MVHLVNTTSMQQIINLYNPLKYAAFSMDKLLINFRNHNSLIQKYAT